MLSEINPISFASHLLKLYMTNKVDLKNSIHLGNATGFIYKKNQKQYLVTNLHVLSGRNINTEKIESTSGAIPEYIEMSFSTFDDTSKIVEKQESFLRIQLYNQEHQPRWLIHPIYKRKVDISVICLDLDASINLFAINDIQETQTHISIADDIFVIGYPLSLGTNENKAFPIWKNATIASEPSINYFTDGRKTFVIDGTTRAGMSGSPVIRYSHFIYNKDKDGINFGMCPQCTFSFLGVYSGRLHGKTDNSNVESFLGLVWKKELIDEIIDANVLDKQYEN